MRLEQFEAWSKCVPLSLEAMVPSELWKQYYDLQHDILQKMKEAQKLAVEVARHIKAGELAAERPKES